MQCSAHLIYQPAGACPSVMLCCAVPCHACTKVHFAQSHCPPHAHHVPTQSPTAAAGGSETLMGLSLSVTCAAESLVFYFLPAIMAIGIKRCMHLVFLAFLVRMGWYACLAYAPTPWLVRLPLLCCCAAKRA